MIALLNKSSEDDNNDDLINRIPIGTTLTNDSIVLF